MQLGIFVRHQYTYFFACCVNSWRTSSINQFFQFISLGIHSQFLCQRTNNIVTYLPSPMYLLDTGGLSLAFTFDLCQVGLITAVLFPQVRIPGMEITRVVDWLKALLDLDQSSAIDVSSRRISFNILLNAENFV